MGAFDRFVKQCGKPTGKLGRFVGRNMNFGHTPLRRFGLKQVTLNNGDQILDIGCGGGQTIKELYKLNNAGTVFGIDFSEDMVKLSKKINRKGVQTGRVKILHGSVSSLPFDNDTFDLITAMETYYFWPDLINDFKEIKRVLKPEGKFLMVNEVFKDEKFDKRNKIWVEKLNMHYHTPEELKELLRSAGFEKIDINPDYKKGWLSVLSE